MKRTGVILMLAAALVLVAETAAAQSVHNVTQDTYFSTIQAAINAANPGNIIDVGPGTYAERLSIGMALDIRGAQYGVDPTLGGRTNPAVESTVDITGIGLHNPNYVVELTAGATGTSFSGFTLLGSPIEHYADETVFHVSCGDLAIEDNIMHGFFGVLHKGGTNVSINRNQITVNKGGITLQPGTYDSFSIDGNVVVLGTIPIGDAAAMYMTGATNIDITGNDFSGFPGGNAVGGNSVNYVTISGNDLSDCVKGVNFWGSTTFIDVADNDITGCSNAGIGIKGQDITVTGNDLSGCDIGFEVKKHVLVTERVTVSGNDFSGCTTFGLKVDTANVLETVDASGNYWGSTDAAAVKAEANAGDGVDYTPWLAGGTAANPGYVGDYATLYVDDDSDQTGTTGRIQEGVDLVSGSTVNVLPGTYVEAILIDRPMSVLGATAGVNKNGYAVPADYAWDDTVESIIQHPNPGGGYMTIVDIYDTDDVTFKGFVVEELAAVGNLNSSLLRVSTDTHPISNVVVENNIIGPNTNVVSQDGTHGRMGLYIVNDPYTDYGITHSSFSHNKIFDAKGNGNNIFLWSSYFAYTAPGPASMVGTVIDDNEIYGSHRSGIETAGGFADLTISNNEIYGNSGLPGDNPDKLNYGHGILLIRGASDKVSDPLTAYGPVDLVITGNNIHDNEKSGIYTGPKNDGVYITENLIHDNGWNGVIVDLVGNYWNPQFEDPPYSEQYACYDCAVDVFVNDNMIWGNAGAGTPASDYGVAVNGVPTNGFVLDGEDNWWGDPSGPTHATANPGGTGEKVTDYVDFDPYRSGNIVCVADPTYIDSTPPTKTVSVDYLGGGSGLMFGYTVKFTWDGAIASTTPGSVTQGDLLSGGVPGSTFWNCMSTGTNEITVTCIQYPPEPGVTGPGTMFSIPFTGLSVGTSAIDITIDRIRDKDNQPLSGFFEDDGELIVDVDDPVVANVHIANDDPDVSDTYVKNGDPITVTATVTDDDPLFDATNIVADLRGLGGIEMAHPAYSAPVATWVIASASCTPGNDEHFVTVTVDATDPMGNTAAQGSDDIIADNLAPGAVTAFDASPGNQECELSWTSGGDTYYEGTVVQRADVPGDYPQYAGFVGSWPDVSGSYPTDEGDGTGVYDGTETSHTDGVVDRNIYYYQAFSYDGARNYGPAATTARDLATNYWLGDISDGFGSGWGYDGFVDDGDILMLGLVYGNVDPEDYPGDAECDIGPTVHPDWHRLGLPLPDNKVEFEDAMIFAMNYGVVAAKVVPFLPEEHNGDVLALTLEERGVAGDVVEVALQLEGNSGDVKGMSASVAYDPSQLEFVSATMTEDMSSPLADVFFWSSAENGRVMVDALVLGTGVTIGGSGDVATLTFRVLSAGYMLEVESARIRNADNVELDAKLGDLESGGDLPLAFRLVGNTPNPFNPVTKVAYDVPRESDVTIRVYDVSGRVVRTLVDGVVEAGRHAAVWDGRNDAGESVGSGIYFCTMEAPDFHESTKMTLLK